MIEDGTYCHEDQALKVDSLIGGVCGLSMAWICPCEEERVILGRALLWDEEIGSRRVTIIRHVAVPINCGIITLDKATELCTGLTEAVKSLDGGDEFDISLFRSRMETRVGRWPFTIPIPDCEIALDVGIRWSMVPTSESYAKKALEILESADLVMREMGLR